MVYLLSVAFTAVLVVLVVIGGRHTALRREEFIRSHPFPKGLFERFRKHHPHLTDKECQLVAHGLRQFFLAHHKSGRKFVSMPSKVVDDLWHEFILFTKNYEAYCRSAFGKFFHHTPAVALGHARQNNAGLRRCWWFACKDENINPRKPTRLPLLFALDAKLQIAGGFSYVADCGTVTRNGRNADGISPYCGGDFSDASFDGSLDGFDGDSSDAGSHGGHGGDGDAGGDGCGGGGCGGD